MALNYLVLIILWGANAQGHQKVVTSYYNYKIYMQRMILIKGITYGQCCDIYEWKYIYKGQNLKLSTGKYLIFSLTDNKQINK